jgi:peptidoglycan/LPS O-acetylase OafA/YrhL
VRHGQLAVDFFFVLSGFVIHRAYQGRLDAGMGFVEFVKVRLIRLGPMFYVGLGLGVLAYLAKHIAGAGVGDYIPLIVAIALEALFLPTFMPLTAPGYVGNWPLNQPSWSLSFELWVNFLYAAIARRLTTQLLWVLIAIGAASIVTHVLVLGGVKGWDTIADFPDFLLRATRTIFSFFTGVLLSRSIVTREKASPLVLFSVLAAMLLLGLAFPASGFAGVWEGACVMLLFPAIIWLGAWSTPPKQARMLSWLGNSRIRSTSCTIPSCGW